MGFTSIVNAIARRESKRDLGGWAAQVWVFTTDRQEWSVAHTPKLRLMIGRCDGWMGLMRRR